MLQKNLFLLFVLLSVLPASAQDSFIRGDKVLNLGMGIGSTQYTGSLYTDNVPPLSISLEAGIKDELFDENSGLGIGGYLGFSGSRYSGWKTETSFSNIIIGARGAFHYEFIDHLDTYAGLMLGYRIVNWEAGSVDNGQDSAASSGFASAFFLGGRYYFNENLGGMLELGYGISYLNVGIALRF